MAGLREQQKKKRRAGMLTAAKTLFAKRGYESVKLEEIAKEAEVSPGTLYNTFETKNDLLLAVIVEDFEHGFDEGRKVLEGPLSDALSAVNALCRSHYFRHDEGPSNEMWRFAVAAHTSRPGSLFALEYQKCLSGIRGQICELLARLKREGHLPEQADTEELAYLIDSICTLSFLEYIRSGEAPSDALLEKQFSMNARLIGWVLAGGGICRK